MITAIRFKILKGLGGFAMHLPLCIILRVPRTYIVKCGCDIGRYIICISPRIVLDG